MKLCPYYTGCSLEGTGPTRRGMLDALLDHLGGEPELWQVQMVGAACLGRRGVMDVGVVECD